MPLIEYRSALPGDLPGLLPLVREFYSHFAFPWDEERKGVLLARVLDDSDLGRLWVVTVDGQISGYALLPLYFSVEFDGRVALLDELFVTAELRGTGIGTRLLEEVVQAVSQERILGIRLEVDRRHPDATALYTRLGFRPDGRETWTRRLGPFGADSALNAGRA